MIAMLMSTLIHIRWQSFCKVLYQGLDQGRDSRPAVTQSVWLAWVSPVSEWRKPRQPDSLRYSCHAIARRRK